MAKKTIVVLTSAVVLVAVVLLIVFSSKEKKAASLAQTATAQKSIEISSQTPTSTVAPPTATATSTITSTVVPTQTASPTPKVEALRIVTFDAVYNVSSQFTLEMTGVQGEYYATGRTQDGKLYQYNCAFHKTIPNRLVCSGGPLPLYSTINFQVYRKETGELVFSQEEIYDFAIHGEVIPSPTGVYCEAIPIHFENETELQREKGCFKVDCWQNGLELWKTDNSCLKNWPFLWNYSHPTLTK